MWRLKQSLQHFEAVQCLGKSLLHKEMKGKGLRRKSFFLHRVAQQITS